MIRIAKEWGIETEGKDIYDLAHEVAETGLMEYIKPLELQEILKESTGITAGTVGKNELAPRQLTARFPVPYI